MVKDVLHIVYSTAGYHWTPYMQKKLAAMSEEERKKIIRKELSEPYCCDLTKQYFRELLAKEAQEQGMRVVRWPFKDQEQFFAIKEACLTGKMEPGSIAVLCHAWFEDLYEKECVPSWDFYPVLNELMEKHDMIYPHPELDQLHSEKRYSSKYMAPTRFLNFVRGTDGWKISGHGGKDVARIVREEMCKLRSDCKAKGLGFTDVMLKQGLSWGGHAVIRLPVEDVVPHFTDFVMPELDKNPEEAKRLTLMLQAKLDIVSELRWCMVNGELRSKEWKSLNAPKQHQLAESAGYQDAKKAQALVVKFLAKDMGGKYTLDELEEKMGVLCKKVYQEAVADAYGFPPLYMRVDLLLDKQGRIWLGERESWGADVNGNDTKEKMNPTYKELANKMISQSKAWLALNRKKKSPKEKKSPKVHPLVRKVSKLSKRLVCAVAKSSKQKAAARLATKFSEKRRAPSEESTTSPLKRRRVVA